MARKVAHRFGHRPRIYTDATGVGSGVIDVAREVVRDGMVVPVTIVAGVDHLPGSYRAGKGWLLGRLQSLFERGLIRLPLPRDEFDRIRGLVAELQAFEVRATQSGGMTASAPPGQHDDRVLSLMLAVMEDPSKQVIRRGPSVWV